MTESAEPARVKRPDEGDGGHGQPSTSQMMKALRKSGYLFEHEVATAMEKWDFYVERSHAYTDPEEGKSREVDVRAFKFVLRNKMYRFDVVAHVLMECKDSSSPFVFLQTRKNKADQDSPEGREYYFP